MKIVFVKFVVETMCTSSLHCEKNSFYSFNLLLKISIDNNIQKKIITFA